MLKNLLKSKKFMAAVAIVTTVALGTGGTFAWFFAKSDLGLAAVMRNTSFVAQFDDLNDAILEPGVHQEIDGTIRNTGTTDIFIKLDFHPSVTIRSFVVHDDDYNLDFWGGWLDPADYVLIDRDPNVQITPRADEWIPYDYVNESFYSYYRDDEGRLYLLISGQEAIPALPFNIDLSGPGMGNVYQNALINFSKTLFGVAEWWSDECLDTYYGKVWDDFEFVYGLNADDFGVMDATAARIQQRVAEIRAERN